MKYIFDDCSGHQPWARYLEIEIGEGNPTRPEIWDMSGCPIPSFPRFFPAFLGQKKIGKNRGKSGKI